MIRIYLQSVRTLYKRVYEDYRHSNRRALLQCPPIAKYGIDSSGTQHIASAQNTVSSQRHLARLPDRGADAGKAQHLGNART